MQLPKTYEPGKYEADIYKLWEESGAFAPNPKAKGKPFCIIMPPPNANGSLHAGHLMYVVEDIMTRYARMQDRPALWLPGTDHAGIETQFVYERDVLGPQNKTRFDLGPEQFYQEVMEYVKSTGDRMINGFRAVGFSADWSKLKFTLDKDIIDTVYDTFKRLHADGYVYRGNRLVNWCPRCQAAFADIELDREERTDELYTLNYGPVQIATVRPETIFADVAVAVNPNDERYSQLVDQSATLPLADRPLPIITDSYVDPGFGTGALKITPGHDPNDYEIGRRHELPEISVIDSEGKLINVPDEFAGMTVTEGRTAVVKALERAGKLVKREPYQHAVAIHDRCGTLIEPLLSEQWFLRIKELNRPVIEALENDAIQIHPRRFKKIALNWLEQEHDWCISRQIWWGIRMPIFYKTSHDPGKKPYIIATDETEAISYYGEGNYRAETDTFDTWFSSGQWPFATLMSVGEFERFYPTTLIGTAREILHKWVTRMIMFGLYRTGQIPFQHIYLWGLVTDEKGQKLSKSKGNYGDPMEITAKYGTDALRMALTTSNTPGNDSPLSEKQVESMRNFCNKLWNVSRYILAKTDETYQPIAPEQSNLADTWIYARLQQQTAAITKLLETYRFNEAANAVYHLLWDDFADWYLEANKVSENRDLLVYGLETILKLAHPFVPFVTEAIWQQMPWQSGYLISAAWPKPAKFNTRALTDFEILHQLVTGVRNICAELQLEKPILYHREEKLLQDNQALITKLAGLSACEAVSDGRGLPIPGIELAAWLDVDEPSFARYRQKLEQALDESQQYATRLQSQLNNSEFVRKAPKSIIADARSRLQTAQSQAETLQQQLDRL